MFFDAEYLICHPQIRECFIRLMGPLWPGWRLDWAYSTSRDLAEYAGNNPENDPRLRPSARATYAQTKTQMPQRTRLANLLVDLTPLGGEDLPAQMVAEMMADLVAGGNKVHVDPQALLDPASLTQSPEDRLPCLVSAMREAFDSQDWPTEADFRQVAVSAVVSQARDQSSPSNSFSQRNVTPPSLDLVYGFLFLILGTLLTAFAVYLTLDTDVSREIPMTWYPAGPVLLALSGYIF